MNNKTIYISGPMTGIENHNFDKFYEVADHFQEQGWKVINPATNFNGRTDLPREDYMRVDFEDITSADAIVMLPGWKNSRGATAEYLVAIECGLEVYDGETFRLTEDLPMPSVMLVEDAEPFDELPDSGKRQQFESGAVRDEAFDKPRLELISPFAEMRLGHHLRRGAEKYAARNWEAGIPFDRCIASLKRHLAAYQVRSESEDHLAAIMANAMFLAHYESMIVAGVLPEELDDRPLYHSMQEREYGFACA